MQALRTETHRALWRISQLICEADALSPLAPDNEPPPPLSDTYEQNDVEDLNIYAFTSQDAPYVTTTRILPPAGIAAMSPLHISRGKVQRDAYTPVEFTVGITKHGDLAASMNSFIPIDIAPAEEHFLGYKEILQWEAHEIDVKNTTLFHNGLPPHVPCHCVSVFDSHRIAETLQVDPDDIPPECMVLTQEHVQAMDMSATKMPKTFQRLLNLLAPHFLSTLGDAEGDFFLLFPDDDDDRDDESQVPEPPTNVEGLRSRYVEKGKRRRDLAGSTK